MTSLKENNWSEEDGLILSDFGSLNPSIAQFPHTIFKASRVAIEFVFEIVNAKGGIWGTELKFHVNGKEYECDEWPIVQDFRLWELPQNQIFLLESGWGLVSLLDFTMVIGAKSDPSLLEEIGVASSFFGKRPTFDWQADFENLPLWLDRLGWAYVSLKLGENDHALFVARKGGEQLCKALQAHLFAAGYKSAKLRRSQERVHWDGPMVL